MGHMRKTRALANSIEEVQRKFKERMSDKQLVDMDTSIFKKTEEKKNRTNNTLIRDNLYPDNTSMNQFFSQRILFCNDAF